MLHLVMDPEDRQGDLLEIRGSKVNHIRNVLRLHVGEEISVRYGEDDREYRYGIESMNEEMVLCRLRFIKESKVELPVKVYLFQGLPKADKMDFIVQKAVELGAFCIIPVSCKRSIVKLDEEKARKKTARWQQIAESAASQSRRALIPEVRLPMNMQDAVALAKQETDCRFIPYELQGNDCSTKEVFEGIKDHAKALSIFIGPEGGFEKEEIEEAKAAGIQPISLGRRILRTETAGMVVLSWLIYCLEIN